MHAGRFSLWTIENSDNDFIGAMNGDATHKIDCVFFGKYQPLRQISPHGFPQS